MTLFSPITDEIARGFAVVITLQVGMFLLGPLYRRLVEVVLFGDPVSRKGPR